MKRLIFTPAAQDDIDHIWHYSFNMWGIEQAERYIEGIRDTCQSLAAGYKRGRGVDIRKNYLKHPCGQHMIYFLEHNNYLEVIRILHGKQDVPCHLLY